MFVCTAALAPGSTSFLYQVWTANWDPEVWMGGVAEHVVFVGYRELIELRRASRFLELPTQPGLAGADEK